MKQNRLNRVALIELVLLKNVRGQKADFRAQSSTANNVVDLLGGEQVDREGRVGWYDWDTSNALPMLSGTVSPDTASDRKGWGVCERAKGQLATTIKNEEGTTYRSCEVEAITTGRRKSNTNVPGDVRIIRVRYQYTNCPFISGQSGANYCCGF